MLALEENEYAIVILRPDLVLKPSESDENRLKGKNVADDICSKFEEQYLDVKMRKQLYLSHVEALNYFHYLNSRSLEAIASAFSRGLCEVLVLENLCEREDGAMAFEVAANVVEKHFVSSIGDAGVFCCRSSWECARALEFFFPHLNDLPVERTLAVIKPDGVSKGSIGGITLEDEVEAKAVGAGLLVIWKKKMVLTKDQAQVLCEGYSDRPGATSVLMKSPHSVVMCLEGRGAVWKWQLLCGPLHAGFAREIAPQTLRAIWGTDGTSNALHASSSLAEADHEIQILFPPNAADGSLERTLCLVRPASATPSACFMVRTELEAHGFIVQKDAFIKLSKERARDLYSEYTTAADFDELLQEATSGPCLALVVCRTDAVAALRRLVGPEILTEAQEHRPSSLCARLGTRRTRNPLHCSNSSARAASEVLLLFPELGVDGVPNNEEVSNLLHRKPALASAGLRSIMEAAGPIEDISLSQLLSKGLMALCEAQPTGVKAAEALSKWLAANNPNTTVPTSFQPPERKRINFGLNRDGQAFSVEVNLPEGVKKPKPVIDVDTLNEVMDKRVTGKASMPVAILVCGGTENLRGELCRQLQEIYIDVIYLHVPSLVRDEIQACTPFGTAIAKAEDAVRDSLVSEFVCKRMGLLTQEGANRFLLDGFPTTAIQAQRFEMEVANVAFVLYLKPRSSPDHQSIPAERVALEDEEEEEFDDFPVKQTSEAAVEVVKEEPSTPISQLACLTVVDAEDAAAAEVESGALGYYTPIGKVRLVNLGDNDGDIAGPFQQAKRHLGCHLVYLLGPPGLPLGGLADGLARDMSSHTNCMAIHFPKLLSAFAASSSDGADKVKLALSKGLSVEAALACPLVRQEIQSGMSRGIRNFVIESFPQSVQQAQFLEHCVPSITKPLLIDMIQPEVEDLAMISGCNHPSLSAEMARFFGEDMRILADSLPGLQRLPCRLLGARGVDEVDHALRSALRPALTYGVTLVLGPHCSGATSLAKILARQRYAQIIDCELLAARAAEEASAGGAAVLPESPFGRLLLGAAVPFLHTLNLLKRSATLNDSDLVLVGFTGGLTELMQLSEDFRIDSVLHVEGDCEAISQWRQRFVDPDGSLMDQEQIVAARAFFDRRQARHLEVAEWFAKRGRLERLGVDVGNSEESIREETLRHLKTLDKALAPQLVIVTSLSERLASKHAALLANSCKAGLPITPAFLQQWVEQQRLASDSTSNSIAQLALGPAVSAHDFALALKLYAAKSRLCMLVLDRYPLRRDDSIALREVLGRDPRLVVHISLPESNLQDFMDKEFEELQSEAEAKGGTRQEKPEDWPHGPQVQLEATIDEMGTRCPETITSVVWQPLEDEDPEKEKLQHLGLHTQIRARLRPRCYIILAPGRVGSAIADAVCMPEWNAGRVPRKFKVIDALELIQPGRRRPDIEERLARARYAAQSSESLPIGIWRELFEEAFADSDGVTGENFLIINYPVVTTSLSLGPSLPAIRDQFSLVQEGVEHMGVLGVYLSAHVFEELRCYSDTDDLSAYKELDPAGFAVQNKRKRQGPSLGTTVSGAVNVVPTVSVGHQPLPTMAKMKPLVQATRAKHPFWRCYAQAKMQLETRSFCELYIENASDMSDVAAKAAGTFWTFLTDVDKSISADAKQQLHEQKRVAELARKAAAGD